MPDQLKQNARRISNPEYPMKTANEIRGYYPEEK